MFATKFKIDYAKDLCKCQNCNAAIPKYGIRFVKQASYNPYLTVCYHINCLFKQFQMANITTGLIESTKDIENFENIDQTDQVYVSQLVKLLNKQRRYKTLDTPDHELLRRIGTLIQEPRKFPKITTLSLPAVFSNADSDDESDYETTVRYLTVDNAKMDDKFDTFVRICNKISAEPAEIGKTEILREFITKGSDGRSFKGDLKMFIRMLLPNYKKNLYDLSTTKLMRLFSRIFRCDYENMMLTLFNKKGDVAKTLRIYFRLSNNIQAARRAKLTLEDVDKYLIELSEANTENEQRDVLTSIASNCTLNELEMIIRLIKKDLRTNLVIKSILNAMATNGYNAFGMSGNLDDIIQRAQKVIKTDGKPGIIMLRNAHKTGRHKHELFNNKYTK